MNVQPRYPGIPVTTNGNQLVSYYTEARITDAGVFYPITPSTEMGENYQLSFAEGKLNVFGQAKLAIEAEGEHAAQGGAIACSVTGKRVVNFTSGQGIVYGVEQYYHAPGKCSTMVLEVSARALTKHALNVHCGHDDIYATLDTGWIILFGKDAQQTADQAVILRRVTEKALNPGINAQDGFLTSHLERTFFSHEAGLLREMLGAPDDLIDCPTEAQRTLFGPKRRRVPAMIDLTNPALLGPVQNQEHYMNGVAARRDNFDEPILGFLEESYEKFAELTGRRYGLVSRFRSDDAETVFVALGSAVENIEAAVDHLRARGQKVGAVHVNVLRPFPEKAIIEALRGKARVIVLERTDEPMAPENPLTKDIRAALFKARENARERCHAHLPALSEKETPRLFSGVYGLGSRDFRPEGILGAYEFATGKAARQDGRKASDGEHFFFLGIDHPYAVISKDSPSLLPDHAIAVRFHSIGGWGMITTGKNLGEVIGGIGEFVAERENARDEFGRLKDVVHVSANPKYGSEKKGAPTEYFLVVAPERVRVNCDLKHVDVVLCCDPKAFTHRDPLYGLKEGGAFVWECEVEPESAWQRIPPLFRREIRDKNIRVFILPGFAIARAATDREELQVRMQGNAFLGAFFAVSSFLKDFKIDQKSFRDIVHAQYKKKFGRFGESVVASNMDVMGAGFEQVREVPHGDLNAPDKSTMRGTPLLPSGNGCEYHGACKVDQPRRAPVFQRAFFDAEFRAGLGYHQPASVYASTGMMAAATGAGATKFVSRRELPVFLPQNCTQCMECISACPDTALPNTAQPLSTILSAAIKGYVREQGAREALLARLDVLESGVRARMNDALARRGALHAPESAPALAALVDQELAEVRELPESARKELVGILQGLPLAYAKTTAIFAGVEKKNPGKGGIFSIFVSDLCKGCGECVTQCGDHQALKMVPETESVNAAMHTAHRFLDLLPDTPADYLGLYNTDAPMDSRPAALRNHLMVRRNYEALASGDGACAGCGEKSVLHAVASLTEASMRPLYHKKAERLDALCERLKRDGLAKLARLAKTDTAQARRYRIAVAHLVMGLGGEDAKDTQLRLQERGMPSDETLIDALIGVMRQEAFNHRDLVAIDGRLDNGMAVMAMGAHTGCNSVYGSTPPNNPHPYPWMNSLFQDGVTVAWVFGESFIQDHARRSIVPERLARALLERENEVLGEAEYFRLAHFCDADMSDAEIAELPKAWAIGGDGGMGDIGFQNVSKVVLQNRPNVKVLMLDTQVYSNTGGQNSDSALMPGGFDMNQFGAATQGKLTEKKGVAECFTSGHGSPYVAQVSIANAAKMYKTLLDALAYRGTAFIQAFTTCQPEHGVADDVSASQAKLIRDSRGMPEFVFDPSLGESFAEALDLKGNPQPDRDWWETKNAKGEKYRYTVAHWAVTEARFRRHLKKVTPDQFARLEALENALLRITQHDVVHRRFLDQDHRAYVSDFGVGIEVESEGGALVGYALSRQMVLFAVERRKSWRLLQSKAGLQNLDYQAQRALLLRFDKGEVTIEDLRARGLELWQAEREKLAQK